MKQFRFIYKDYCISPRIANLTTTLTRRRSLLFPPSQAIPSHGIRRDLGRWTCFPRLSHQGRHWCNDHVTRAYHVREVVDAEPVGPAAVVVLLVGGPQVVPGFSEHGLPVHPLITGTVRLVCVAAQEKSSLSSS